MRFGNVRYTSLSFLVPRLRRFCGLQRSVEEWECGLCHIITRGEWEAEVRPKGSEIETEWQQVCQSCCIDIKKDFIPDEEEYESEGI